MGRAKTKTGMSDEVVPGRQSPFTNQQRAHIRSYYDDWNKLLIEHDPTSTDEFSDTLRAWRDETSDDIMHSDLFKDLDTSQMNRIQWERVSPHTLPL